MEPLRVFNQAVTTSRLYPAVSPQVTNAVDKAHRAIEEFIRKNGALSFGSNNDDLQICGTTVSSGIGTELKAFVIYRHLEILKLKNVVFPIDFDRELFDKILTVFVARKEKISREGGGQQFVKRLSLEHYFPDYYEADPQAERVERGLVSADSDFAGLSDELLGYLFGEHNRQEAHQTLEALFQKESRAGNLIAAGITRVLEHLQKVENTSVFMVSASFTRFLKNVDGFVSEDRRALTTESAVKVLQDTLSAESFFVLCIQKYPDGFGKYFFSLFIEFSPNNLFDQTLRLLRERSAELRDQEKGDSPQIKILVSALEKLLSTTKGKQFLGREKAQALIDSGEKERQNKRLEAGINAILDGSTDSLKNDEIVFSLPSTVEELILRGDVEDAAKIVEKIAGEMLGGDDIIRRRLIQSLILIGEKLLDDSNWVLLDKCVGAFVSWVRESDDGDFVYEKCVFLLQSLMDHFWERDNYSRGDQILSVFYKIRSKQLQKSAPVRALVGRIQDRSNNRNFLESLLQKYLAEQGGNLAGERLSKLGRPAGNFLIDALLENGVGAERMKILSLLTKMKPFVVPVVLERLQKPLPWYGKRNLIKIAGEVAGPGQVENILPFLGHEDIRVQREAFVCIHRISRDRQREALLSCLEVADESLQSQVVKALLPFSDTEIAERLCVLLKKQEHYSEKSREPLVLEILRVLARSASAQAVPAIKQFLENRARSTHHLFSDQVWEDAERTLRVLRETSGLKEESVEPGQTIEFGKRAQDSGKEPHPLIPAQKENKKPVKNRKDYSQLPGAQHISALLGQEQKEQAKEAILEQITKTAREQNFSQAELLRDWLMDIDAMALSDIILAAEIIEEEKVASIETGHAEAWAELYEELSTEEFATLYHAMDRKSYANEEIIVRQGALQSRLYFVTSGKIKLFYEDKRGENLVKVVSRGEIIGAETVFDASVWTVSASCMQRAEVMILKVEKLYKWREDYPSLESKLSDYCMKSNSLEQFFRMSGRDRRASKRHKVSGRVNNMLLDSKGQETGITSKGDLCDISTGGISFFLRISQKKNARLLLGRNIRVTVPTTGRAKTQLALTGIIIAVRGHQAMENEYSVHVKFNKNLPSADLQSVISNQ